MVAFGVSIMTAGGIAFAIRKRAHRVGRLQWQLLTVRLLAGLVFVVVPLVPVVGGSLILILLIVIAAYGLRAVREAYRRKKGESPVGT